MEENKKILLCDASKEEAYHFYNLKNGETKSTFIIFGNDNDEQHGWGVYRLYKRKKREQSNMKQAYREVYRGYK